MEHSVERPARADAAEPPARLDLALKALAYLLWIERDRSGGDRREALDDLLTSVRRALGGGQ